MTGALAGTSGAKPVVHDPSLPPLLEENAIDLQPNTATSIAVQMVRNISLKQQL
jgi:hypothetical protein